MRKNIHRHRPELRAKLREFFALVPKGRDEQGLAHTMQWIRHHDRYEPAPSAAGSCCGGQR